MFRTLVVFSFLAATAFGKWEKGFNYKFGLGITSIGKSIFIDLPQSRDEAVAANWSNLTALGATPHEGYNNIELWSPSDEYTSSVYYDRDTGSIAGYRMCFNMNNFEDPVFDWVITGYQSWTVDVNGTTLTFQCHSQYYESKEWMSQSAQVRKNSYDNDNIVQDSLCMGSSNNGLYCVLNSVSALENSAELTRQNCFVGMGNHYFYNFTRSLPCESEYIFSCFVLEWSGKIIGYGCGSPGKYTTEPGKINHFENPGRIAMKMIAPTAPECYYDIGDNPGMNTRHIYFIKIPYLINCLW